MGATNSLRTFAAIAYNEVLLNSKRVAPYALIVLFTGVAVLGWAKGPAMALGWATNSDFYIARGLKAFSFLFGVPIFNAVIMGNAVIRDFRLEVDPLTFSKPLSRAQYLGGKFFGNFAVLTCCMAAFPLTQLALQAFHPAQMVVQSFKVLPYFTHFFFFVVITQFAFAAFFFMVGALTRNNKIVYFLAISFYPIFIASMLFLVNGRWKTLLDPFLLNSGPSKNGFGNSAAYLNQYVYSYTLDMIWNRVGLLVIAGVCLTWLYLRFTPADRLKKTSPAETAFELSTTGDIAYGSDGSQEIPRAPHATVVSGDKAKNKTRFRSPFFAIFRNEVLLNSKRVAPYIVAALSAGNAVLWWGWGPATGRNMATNSDAFIAGVLPFFCFLFQPLLAMLIMADPTIRDFRAEINPLIFSKPVSRGEYLLGKFFGNFFTLSCCQSMFVATLFVLQWVPKHGMVVQEAKFLAYPKHFLAYVVISYLPLAAFYFTVGTLTRNVKIVYGLGIAIYPVYISYAIVFLKRLPWLWSALLDPLLINWANRNEIHATSAERFNQLVIVYDSIFIANRMGMIFLTAICLTILYLLFSNTERSKKTEHLSVLNLSTAAERVYYSDPLELIVTTSSVPSALGGLKGTLASREVPALPEVVRFNKGIRSTIDKLIAAIGVEFRLLRAERSLVVVAPLAIFLSLLEVAFYPIHSDVSLTAAYASNTATSLLIFLIGIAVFYTGEAMHRDREVRIEPFLWTTPVSNSVLILSKFLSTLVLLFGLIAIVGFAAVVIQIIRQHTPIDFVAYLRVYGLILLPSAFILTAVSVAATVVMRNKYAFYVVSIGTGAALFYLYSNGHNHWLYNPTMYRLWTYADLATASSTILLYRIHWMAIAGVCLVLAHLFFARRSRRKANLPLPFALR
jgi:ABC-type transport system involved in multi-copper enzyme maturation permease subunit